MRALIALLVSSALCLAGRDDGRSLRVPLWTESSVAHGDDLKASLNGKPAKVLGLLGPEDPMVLLLVLDLVGDLSQVAPAQRAIVEVLETLPPHIFVGVMRAQDGFRVLADPSGDREKAASAVQTLAVSGRAALLDTIETAAALGDSMLSVAEVRTAVLYITDSDVHNYREDFTNPVVNRSDSRDLSRRFPQGLIREKIAKLNNSLVRTQTPVFIVHLNYRSDTLNEAYQTGLMELAATTGGRAEFCRTIADIPKTIQTVWRHAIHSWTAVLQLPENVERQSLVSLTGRGAIQHRTRFQLGNK
jgi:hypothetical protein